MNTASRYEQRRSGLVVPAEKSEPPKPRRPLEIEDSEDRREIHQHLQELIHLLRGGIMDRDRGEARKRLIYFVAGELLGEGVAFEELC